MTTLPSEYLYPSWVTAYSSASLMAMPRLPVRFGIAGQDGASGVGLGAGAGHDPAAPGLHHDAAIGLLLVADGDHKDLALQAEELGGKAQGAAPLTGPGLGGKALQAFLLGIVGLGHGGVGLVAARAG